LKGLGYLISTVSVLLLGAAAWPKPGDPPIQALLVGGGMAASILGMFVRYLSHRKDKREIEEAKRT
jgi:uncharacterized membrane protein YhhN